MIPLTQGELALFRAPNEAAMQDQLVHIPLQAARDSYGQENPDWANAPDGETWPCGFKPTGGSETSENLSGRTGAEALVVKTDAEVRLPLEAEGTIGPHDRVRIVRRYGVLLAAPLVFEVVGSTRPGPTGLVLGLQRVEP